ncbi:MAG: hypothetical protein II793_03925 [Bacteroidales bacterium]|nr:hypothetical protein [Bacteroidales bacterium]
MSIFHEIGDDEIRIIGTSNSYGGRRRPWLKWVLIAACIIVVVVVLILIFGGSKGEQKPPVDPAEETVATADESVNEFSVVNAVEGVGSSVLVSEVEVNGKALRLFVPRNVVAELVVGDLDTSDRSLVFVVQAADIRKDNGGIVGAFVLKGEPLAWGLSKRGYCAIIDGQMRIGVADNSPLFEKATETEGYFFRQFALVDNGNIEYNPAQSKLALRRGLCQIGDSVVVVESIDMLSLDDFSTCLSALGAQNAIYLVGGEAFGLVLDENGRRYAIGRKWGRAFPNVNYLVFRRA